MQIDGEGKSLNNTTDTVELRLQKATYETSLTKGLTTNKVFKPSAGLKELRVIVLDHPTGNVGSLIIRGPVLN